MHIWYDINEILMLILVTRHEGVNFNYNHNAATVYNVLSHPFMMKNRELPFYKK